MKKVSKSKKDTAQIAQIFLQRHLKEEMSSKNALIVGLSGDLGSGKTAFTQAFAKHLGIKNKVSSPTFVIMKKYPIKFGSYKFFFHLDAYRLKNEQELLSLGWGEIINQPEHIVFIEWPENVKKAIPKNAKKLFVSHSDYKNRSFEFK